MFSLWAFICDRQRLLTGRLQQTQTNERDDRGGAAIAPSITPRITVELELLS
jgi:hypothetical protein